MKAQTQEQVKQLVNHIPGDYSEQLASLKQLIAHGNLKSLDDAGRLKYYAAVCESAGLNPLTQPFEFIEYKGGLKMYPTKQCAEQLRKIHGIGCEKVEHKVENDLYYVTVTIKDKTGRPDIATGIIPIGNKKGEELANLIMKTETKAKRRATLSICGLGFLMDMDEDDAREKTVSQQVKPEEYKLLSEKETVEFASAEQVAIIVELSDKLQKGAGYSEKVVKLKLGHKDLTKIPKKFADEWQANLQKRFDENQKFVNEMDGESA